MSSGVVVARLPVLARFELHVLKDRSSTNKVQVAAADAVVQFHRQGATVSDPGGLTIGPGATVAVPVYHTGALRVGDIVRKFGIAVDLSVTGLDASGPSVMLHNDGTSAVGLGKGNRLLAMTDREIFTSNPIAEQDPLADHATADGAGYLAGYVTEFLYDFVLSYGVTGVGVVERLFLDARGSWVMS